MRVIPTRVGAQFVAELECVHIQLVDHAVICSEMTMWCITIGHIRGNVMRTLLLISHIIFVCSSIEDNQISDMTFSILAMSYKNITHDIIRQW